MEIRLHILCQSVSKYVNLTNFLLRYLISTFCVITSLQHCDCSIIITDFSKIKQDLNIMTSYPVKISRSLVECSQLCSFPGNCCGFKYHKMEKTCVCLYDQDFVNPNFKNQHGMAVYLHKDCDYLLEVQTTKGSKSTTRTTTSKPTKTTSITSMETTTATSKTSLTTEAPAQTTDTFTTVNVQTTTKALTTAKTTEAMPTTTRNIPTITTKPPTASFQTTTMSPKTTANAPTTTISTVNTTSQCATDALLCLTNVIYLFSGIHVYSYDTINEITVGSKTSQPISSVFHSTSSTVIAAFADMDSIYIFTENNEIHLYSASSESFNFKKTLTWIEHFGISHITSIDDIIYTSSGEQYVISGDNMYIVSSSGKVKNVPLDNNGNKNVYKSINFSERPTYVTGACAIDSMTHAFTDSSLHLFDFATRRWTKYSKTIC